MLVSAVILGLLSSFHCLGMCGPIAFALPIDRSNSSKGALQSGLYHFGRLLAYGSIGLLFGLIGKGLYLSGFQQRLSILLGLLMILTAVLPMRLFNQSSLTRPLYIFIGRLKSNLKLYLSVEYHCGRNHVLTLFLSQKQESCLRPVLFEIMTKMFVFGTPCISKKPPLTIGRPDMSTCKEGSDLILCGSGKFV